MIIAGIDEVGRWPLAWPVTLACVIQQWPSTTLSDVRDSKQLTHKQRDTLSKKIMADPNLVRWTAERSAWYIDMYGIIWALHATISDIIAQVITHFPDQNIHFLLDGNHRFGIVDTAIYTVQTIIKWDQSEPLIAAASIIAKVARDKDMVDQSLAFPHYGRNRNKWYGTAAHCLAIKQHGLSPLHRKSFCRRFVEWDEESIE